mgnify:CR=1 FL=1
MKPSVTLKPEEITTSLALEAVEDKQANLRAEIFIILTRFPMAESLIFSINFLPTWRAFTMISITRLMATVTVRVRAKVNHRDRDRDTEEDMEMTHSVTPFSVVEALAWEWVAWEWVA